jgi:SAM-dependent methyltransferase
LQNLNRDLLIETERLTRSWALHEEAWLQNYLVAGVEDPRVNLQSILSRHFLIRSLAGQYFDALMQQEYCFAATMDWLFRVSRLASDQEGRAVTLYALRKGSDNAEGLEIPPFILEAFTRLPAQFDGSTIPNYIEDFLRQSPAEDKVASAEPVLDTFLKIWHKVLRNLSVSTLPAGQRLSVLEPACGSANDYRFLHRYGIATYLEYFGFDLCEKNIENARNLFPDKRFEHGNVFEISAPAKSFDLCVVHDLLEHLSLAGMEQAVREICRVCRQGACMGFFQMDEIAQHRVRTLDEYHWNLLSMEQMKRLLAQYGFGAQVIHIGSFLSQQASWPETHNPNAYTFILRRL